jgi:uncharacterized membrane protein YraQ (UPF0718 family)/copper chaperone CopZ
MYEIFSGFVAVSWQILGQMAPYLLFGFLVAGVLSVYTSPEWVERHLGGRGVGPVLKASLLGVPIPLCSCGVIPVSASIRRHGASRAATTSFLLSTPQTGVDSIAVTYALLGPVFAIFRPVAALITGLVGGGLVQLFDEPRGRNAADEPNRAAYVKTRGTEGHSQGALQRVLYYGFITLPKDIGSALLVGIIIAGAMAAFIPQDYLNAYIGGGFLSILLLMVAGVPVYVCATASVPIAVGFMHMGASAGAALAFLIAGPATNAAAFTTIWRVLGRRTAVLYIITVAVSAIVCGLVMDWLAPAVKTALPQVHDHSHSGLESGWFYHATAIVLLIVLAFSYRSSGHRDSVEEKDRRDIGVSSFERYELLVKGMTCSHCEESVRRALSECAGVQSVEVDLALGRAIVTGEGLDRDRLLTAVAELGYTAKVKDETD